MVAEFDGKFNRIQVKTSNEEENGAICCWARSSTNHTTNKKLSSYEGEVDYFVFVNQTHDLVALVPIEDLQGQKSMRLRLTPPANGQTKGIRYFTDYSFDKKFSIIS